MTRLRKFHLWFTYTKSKFYLKIVKLSSNYGKFLKDTLFYRILVEFVLLDIFYDNFTI